MINVVTAVAAVILILGCYAALQILFFAVEVERHVRKANGRPRVWSHELLHKLPRPFNLMK